MGFTPSAQPYAAPADLPIYGGLSAAALSSPNTGTAQQTACLLTASEYADGYLSQQFILPLVSWGADLKLAVCRLAAYELICLRGYNPNNLADEQFLIRWKLADGWLRLVAEGKNSPRVVDSSPGAITGMQAPGSGPEVTSPSACLGNTGRTRGTGSR